MEFQILDIVFLAVILFFAIRVMIRGLVGELFSKLAFIAGAFCGLLFFSPLSRYLMQKTDVKSLPVFILDICSFLIIFIAVYLVVRLLQKVVGLAFKGEIMKGLDSSLGFFLGVFEGLLVVAFVLLFLHSKIFFDATKILSQSYVNKFLWPIVSASANLAAAILPK